MSPSHWGSLAAGDGSMMPQEVNFLRSDLLPSPHLFRQIGGVVVVLLFCLGFFAWHYWQIALLQEEITQLERQVAQQNGRLEKIPSVVLSPSVGNRKMIDSFQSIANNAQAGVWLNRMQVLVDRVVLEGGSQAANKPILYTEGLAKQPEFADKWRFSSVSVTPVVAEKRSYTFRVMGERLP